MNKKMNNRISQASLQPRYLDGMILYSADINEIISVLVAGVNQNKFDMDKILMGSSNSVVVYTKEQLESSDANEGDYATLFRYGDEESIEDGDTLSLYRYDGDNWVYLKDLSLIDMATDIEKILLEIESIKEGLDDSVNERIDSVEDDLAQLDGKVDNIGDYIIGVESNVIIVDQKVDTHIEDLNNPHAVTAEQVDTYVKTTIDNKDANTLQAAKDYTYSKVKIDSDVLLLNDSIEGVDNRVSVLQNEKLDKNFSSLDAQTNPLLTDVLVLNRGTAVQKITLGNLLGQVNSEVFEVVSMLPTTGVTNKIYLVPSSNPQTQNALDEFIWVNNAWEKIGSVSVDLSNYFNKTEINSMIEDKVDKVTDETTLPQAYVKDPSGNQVMYKLASTTDIESSIMIRDADGKASILTPTSANHITNKKYVDDRATTLENSIIGFVNTVNNDLHDKINPIIDDVFSLQEYKQDKLTPGTNITIIDNVISASGDIGGTADWEDVENKPELYDKTEINSMLDDKVDKVSGKDLSTNDLTNTLKSNYDTAYTHSQLTHAPSNAQKNSDITKTEIEAKLTGTITSHSHALPAHTHTKSQITDFPTSMPPTAHSTDLLTSGTLGVARGGTGRTDGYAVGVVETRASVLTKIWTGTQAQYDDIGTKDANTLYFII